MKKPTPNPAGDRYQRRKDRERQRQADQSRAGRDIGQIPPVKDPKLRERCITSFRTFCEVCFPRKFKIGWSDDHLEVLERIAACILDGQLYTLAMPRGSGKTTIVQVACLWAILTGRRKYVALIGADRDAAIKLLVALKAELESNEKLLELFPEAIFPIRRLEGKANKATGQLHFGIRTHIEWKGPRIVFPTIRTNPVPVDENGSPIDQQADAPKKRGRPKKSKPTDEYTPCSGAIVECSGILGRVRGMNHTTPAGDQLRPDLFVLDDPQTDRSAVSTSQVSRRLSIITGAVLGLAGPDVAIAGFATVTVIAQNDVADQLLDREKFPDWQGKRYRLVYAWPKRLDLWERYAVLRAEGLRMVPSDLSEATAYYVKNRKDMDFGHKVAWEGRFKPGEISALQSAFNQKLKTPATFDAEYQNDPQDSAVDVELLSVADIESKVSGYQRLELPIEANIVTAFIDVQGQLLYWMVVAWERDTYSGWVLEYGTTPEQIANHFTLRNAQRTLTHAYPRRGLEGRLTAGLTDLIDQLAERRYQVPSSASDRRHASIELIGIDQAWGPSTKTVRSVAASHKHRQLLIPCQGKGFDLGSRGINEWTLKPGELRGDNWIIRNSTDGGRHCLGNSNAYKSFANSRLNVAIGDAGSISLYRPKLATEHRMIAEHWRAEKPSVRTDGDASMEKWTLPPAKPDNHLWDCLYWNCILASIRGVRMGTILAMPKKPRRPKRRKTQLIA